MQPPSRSLVPALVLVACLSARAGGNEHGLPGLDVAGHAPASFAALPRVPWTQGTDPGGAHPFLAIGGLDAFSGGEHQGTRVDEQGRLVLADGVTQGTWKGEIRLGKKGFDLATAGVVAQMPPGASYRIQVRGISADRSQGSRWFAFQPEALLDFGMIIRFIQLIITLIASPGGGMPGLGGVTMSPGPLSPVGPSTSLPTFPGAPTPTYPNPKAPTNPGNPANPVNPIAPAGGLQIIARDQWGAAASTSTLGSDTPQSVVVHHTAGPASGYRGASTIQEIQRFHQNTRGWSDIGYHFIIGPDGKVYEGRPLGTLGAHAPPNRTWVGICLVGDFQTKDTPTGEATGALSALMAQLKAQQGVSLDRVPGHRDVGSTSCPGDSLYQQIDTVKNQALSLGSMGVP